MARKSRMGCLPWLLGLVLVAVWFGGDGEFGNGGTLVVERFEPPGDRSARRPLPGLGRERFIIEDMGPKQDSQGTAFAVDSDGVWMTAEHVTHDCDRLVFDTGEGYVPATQVLESREADAALIRDGPMGSAALPLTARRPQPGEHGYHMGFPAGQAAVVESRFMGAAEAERGPSGGAGQPVYVWAEVQRAPSSDGALGGISGGPTFDERGRVIGINSAATPRRGRLLTTDPDAIRRLARASNQIDDVPQPRPLDGLGPAVDAFRRFVGAGLIVQVYCDVR